MTDCQSSWRRYRGTVSAGEAAAVLSVTRRTVQRWQADGKMPARILIGSRPEYRLVDINDMAARIGNSSPKGEA